MDSSKELVRFVRPAEKRRRIPLAVILALSFGMLVFLSVGGVLALTVGANIRNTLDLLGAQSTLLVDAMEDSLGAEMGQAENAVDGVSQFYAQGEFQIDDNDAMTAALAGALSAAPTGDRHADLHAGHGLQGCCAHRATERSSGCRPRPRNRSRSCRSKATPSA